MIDGGESRERAWSAYKARWLAEDQARARLQAPDLEPVDLDSKRKRRAANAFKAGWRAAVDWMREEERRQRELRAGILHSK